MIVANKSYTLTRTVLACALFSIVSVLGLTSETQAQQPAATIGLGVTDGSPASPPLPAPLLPKGGIYLGAWVMPEGGGGQHGSGSAETAELESRIGRKLVLHVHYYGWKGSFPDAAMRDDAAKGRIPIVSWESGTGLAAVAAGADDAMIAERAQAVKAFSRPVFLRWMWEMNLLGAGHAAAYGDGDKGAEYIAAWRHIWTLFHQQGAGNVVWLWNPSAAHGAAEARRLPAAAFYPGDEFVDWIGADAYDRTEPPVGFVSVFEHFYQDFAGHRKPFMIVETGAYPANQTTYLQQVRTEIKARFPLIQGFLYFDAPGHAKHPWVLTADGTATFATLGKDPYFKGQP